VSSTTAPVPFKASALARGIAAFSGTPGLVIKLVCLGMVNALAVWAATVLVDRGDWIALAMVVAGTVALDVVYALGRHWAIPLKFLLPGTIFLLGFQIAPVVYTISVAFTNYSTGHIATKSDAIKGIEGNSLVQSEDGETYQMTPARDGSGHLVLLLVGSDGKTFVGTPDGLRPLPTADRKVKAGTITAAHGYSVVPGKELFSLDKALAGLRVPVGDGTAIEPQGFSVAVPLKPTLRYDAARDEFVRISDGAVFRDSGKGSFVDAKGNELEPGWETGVGFHNFGRVLRDPLVRGPFLRVLAWTIAFATLTVLLSFAVGLLLALTLDKPGMRFLRAYRSILVLPYATPAFLSLLVWSGLLNDDFGVVNRTLHLSVPWLFDPTWAKVSVILVSVWLTVPYFFMVSLGALQAIPKELVEAAHVDGGGPFAIFRRVRLPLLLVAVAPLLIASFAFNFNNFNNIYLLTAGGPPASDGSIAGSTDILISYTYKLAFAAGKGQNYGLASTIAVFIFIIVATISALAFWKTQSLENLR
jgi:arabinogalactan oligomer/maltooligosaccharide transport system permease protein